jgi:hypothetical protein
MLTSNSQIQQQLLLQQQQQQQNWPQQPQQQHRPSIGKDLFRYERNTQF